MEDVRDKKGQEEQDGRYAAVRSIQEMMTK